MGTDQKGKLKLISREQADNANAKHEKKNRTLKNTVRKPQHWITRDSATRNSPKNRGGL